MEHSNRKPIFSVKMKGTGFKNIAFCMAIVFLISCGGRSANPIMVKQYGDEGKSCKTLEIEMSQTQQEIQRLMPESKKTGKNVALGVAGIFLIVPFFFMDMGHAEKAEIDAFRQRYNHLLVIAAEKECGIEGEQIPEFDKNSAKKIHKEAKATTTEKEKAIIKYAGTGFIINSNGYLITNYHAVKNAKNIKIKTTSGEEMNAVLIMKDASNDIAVLKVNSSPANIEKNLYFGDSAKVKVGDKVSTIGYPFSNILGKEARYTEGTISSLFGIQDDPRWFQISVPIQPGNSGGPLFNDKGEVIGVTVASLDAKNVFEITGAIPQNVNFAIKSAYIKNLISMMPDLGSALVMPTNLSLDETKSQNFIERAKNNIVLIEAK